MNLSDLKKNLGDDNYINQHQFLILSELWKVMYTNIDSGRDLLIRLLEKKKMFAGYEKILTSLLEFAGLFQYLDDNDLFSTADQLAYECHRPEGLDNIILHSEQMNIYQRLLDGENIVLSAPTSFGKSLLIDAMIASKKYNKIVIIVPTIALISETRARITNRFRNDYKIITHSSQSFENKTIWIFTQERYLELDTEINEVDFFVIDEFYKLNCNETYEDRAILLNKAFLKLCSSKAQFLLIGPNIESLKDTQKSNLNYSFIRTDFHTVVADVENYYYKGFDRDKKCIEIAKDLKEPTIIYCKSQNSSNELANKFIENKIVKSNLETTNFASWLGKNYHEEWNLVKLLKNGIAIHHGSLPRAVSHHILSLFNKGFIKFMFCTSTIIEGVNTSAKNIIIYDNKIATKNFDMFTFNNIKGRAGRMFKAFVGKVYVLCKPPQPDLPIVNIPVLTIPEQIPLSLAMELPKEKLSDFSLEQLKKLHAQNLLDISTIKRNSFIPVERMIKVANNYNESQNIDDIVWYESPNNKQMNFVCRQIFDGLLGGIHKDKIFSSSQLKKYLSFLQKSVKKGIDNYLKKWVNKKNSKDITKSIDEAFDFMRQWAEFNFPRYLLALNDIQKDVLKKRDITPGDYSAFATKVKRCFLPMSVTILEEYGLPAPITIKIDKNSHLGDEVDQILINLKNLKVDKLDYLKEVEKSILVEVIKNL